MNQWVRYENMDPMNSFFLLFFVWRKSLILYRNRTFIIIINISIRGGRCSGHGVVKLGPVRIIDVVGFLGFFRHFPLHDGWDRNLGIDSAVVSTHVFRDGPKTCIAFAIDGQSNNELLLSAIDLSDVDEDCAFQKGSSNFVQEVVDMLASLEVSGSGSPVDWGVGEADITLELMLEPPDMTADHDFLVCWNDLGPLKVPLCSLAEEAMICQMLAQEAILSVTFKIRFFFFFSTWGKLSSTMRDHSFFLSFLAVHLFHTDGWLTRYRHGRSSRWSRGTLWIDNGRMEVLPVCSQFSQGNVNLCSLLASYL